MYGHCICPECTYRERVYHEKMYLIQREVDYRVQEQVNRSLWPNEYHTQFEIRETLPFPTINNQLGSAFYDILNHPDYDHDRMVKELTANGSQLHEWRKKADWLRNLEDIYNYGYSDENKTRFF
jgi:CHAD domain-containing protein